MARSSNSGNLPNASLFISVALTIATLYFGRQIFIPLALALVLSFLLTPLVVMVEKSHCGRVPAVLIALTLCFVFTVSVGWGVGVQLLEIASHTEDYKSNLEEKIHWLRSPKNGPWSEATNSIRDLNRELNALPADSQNRGSGELNGKARPVRPIPVQVTGPASNLVQDISSLLGPLAGPVETGGIVIVFTAFTLIKREDLRNRLIRLGGQGQLNVMTQALDDANRRLGRYLLLQFLVNAVYGVLFGLGLYLIGVPHALLWGTIAAFLRLVPYIGTLVASAFPIVIALAVFPGWSHALIVFGLFVVLESVIANAVEPWLYGAHTGISSLAILVAAVFWTMLWGPVGLILSTPLTVCLMLIGRYFRQLRFLEVLLGDEPVLKPEEQFYQRLLAMDQDEARNIAESHLENKSLADLYESVLIPALRLAEEDRHMDALGDRLSSSIYQSTRELIEEFSERVRQEQQKDDVGDGRNARPDPAPLAARVVCVPARDEADELVGMMLASLLEQSGIPATFLPIGAVDEMIEQVSHGGSSIVGVSALPPFAVGQARSLCKRLRARIPGLAIVVGLWDFAGGVPKAQERIGQPCSDAVATTLSEALLQIRRLGQALSEEEAETKSA